MGRARRWVSGLAIAGAVPYLVLKVLWLSGSRVGLEDPAFGRSATMHVANAATLLLDAAAVLLAVAFVTRRRVTAWPVLAPMWVGTGLLAPILLVVPLQLVLGTPEPSGGGAPIADWVFLVVYAGFVWQGLFLLLGFALWSRARWADVGRSALPATPVRTPSVVAWLLLAVATTLVTLQATSRDAVSVPNLVGDVAPLGAAIAGLVLLHAGATARRVPALLLWVGTGATAAWGVYHLVLLLVPNDLAAGGTTLDVVAQGVRVVAAAVAVVAVGHVYRAARRSPI